MKFTNTWAVAVTALPSLSCARSVMTCCPGDERDNYWFTADEKRQRLTTTVQSIGRCTHAVREELTAHLIAEPARTQILARLAHLDKIVADEVRLTTDEAKAFTAITELDKDDKGSFRLGSATDPDATYRIHGEKKSDFGYNVNVAVNDQFVREINAVTGAQPDASGVPTLITEQVAHHDLQPDKFTYDAAAGTGKARADFQAATGGQTQLAQASREPDQAPAGRPNEKLEQAAISSQALTASC